MAQQQLNIPAAPPVQINYEHQNRFHGRHALNKTDSLFGYLPPYLLQYYHELREHVFSQEGSKAFWTHYAKSMSDFVKTWKARRQGTIDASHDQTKTIQKVKRMCSNKTVVKPTIITNQHPHHAIVENYGDIFANYVGHTLTQTQKKQLIDRLKRGLGKINSAIDYAECLMDIFKEIQDEIEDTKLHPEKTQQFIEDYDYFF
jgi:hypothetical protein